MNWTLLKKYGLEVPKKPAEFEEVARIIQEGERAEGNKISGVCLAG